MSVAVVGSVNLDVVVTASRRPEAGETVLGNGVFETIGGKGANQARAAARIAPTVMVGAVGDDDPGRSARAALVAAGVGDGGLVTAGEPTGRAYITLTDDGENSIIVVALANTALTGQWVVDALDAMAPRTVLCQLETPLVTVVAAARWCREHGARFVLNPSPVADLSSELRALADPLIVNRHEAAALAGGAALGVREAALRLAVDCPSVVVTDGSRGAVVVADGELTEVAAPAVKAVDTTGAGDVFAGTMAARLALGDSVPMAAAAAVAAASAVVGLARGER